MNYYAENPLLYYGNNDFSLSTKKEVTKVVNIYRNGGYTILPDHPQTECLSGISLNVYVPNPCLKAGCNTFILPAEPGQPDQQIIEPAHVKTVSMIGSKLKNSSLDYGANTIPMYDPVTDTFITKIVAVIE